MRITGGRNHHDEVMIRNGFFRYAADRREGAMHYLEEQMSRIKDLQKQVHKTLKNMDDNYEKEEVSKLCILDFPMSDWLTLSC